MDAEQFENFAVEETDSSRRYARDMFLNPDCIDKRESVPDETWFIRRSLSTASKTKSFPDTNRTYYNSLNHRKTRKITYTRHLNSEQNLRDLVKKSLLEGKWLCWYDLSNTRAKCHGEVTEKLKRKEILQFQLVQFEVAFNMEIADLVNLAKRSITWNDLEMPKYLKRNSAATIDKIKRNSDVLLQEFDCIWKEKKNFNGMFIIYQKYMDKYEIYITYCRDLQKLREMLYEGNKHRKQVTETKMSEIFETERDLLPIFHLSLICYLLEKLKNESNLKQLDQYHCCRTLTQLKKVEEECCKLVSKIKDVKSTAHGFTKEMRHKCMLFTDRVFQENECPCKNETNDANDPPICDIRDRHQPQDVSEVYDKRFPAEEQSHAREQKFRISSENNPNVAVQTSSKNTLQNRTSTLSKTETCYNKINRARTAISKSHYISSDITNIISSEEYDNNNTSLMDQQTDKIFTSVLQNTVLYPYRKPCKMTHRTGAQIMSDTCMDNYRHAKIFGSFLDPRHHFSFVDTVQTTAVNYHQNLNGMRDMENTAREVLSINPVVNSHQLNTLDETTENHNEQHNNEHEFNSNQEGHKSVGTQTKDSSMMLRLSNGKVQCHTEVPMSKHSPVDANSPKIKAEIDSESFKMDVKCNTFKLIQAINATLIRASNSYNKSEIENNHLETESDCSSYDLVQAINMTAIEAENIETTYIHPDEICEAVNDLLTSAVTVDSCVERESEVFEGCSEEHEKVAQNNYISDIPNNFPFIYHKDSTEMLIGNVGISSEEHYYENSIAEGNGIEVKINHSSSEKNVYENYETEGHTSVTSLSQNSSLSLKKLQKLRESFRSNKPRSLEEEKDNDVEFEHLTHMPLYQNFSFSNLPILVDDGQRFIVDEAEPAEIVQKEEYETPYEDMTFTMRLKTRVQTGIKVPTRRRHHGFRTRWQDTEEVMHSGLLETLSQQEIKLQEAKFEIITSELSYYKSLCILERMFAENESLLNIQILPHNDRDILFSQVKPVKNCSQNFLKDLVTVWEKDLQLTKMADTIIYQANNNFGAYVKYCENLQIIERRLRHLMKNKRFATALKKIEEDEKCEKFPLYTFLMLPMQRATRFHLLADAVLKYMQTPNEEYEKWFTAFETLQSLAQDCNSSVKLDTDVKMKKSEETSIKKYFWNRFKMKK